MKTEYLTHPGVSDESCEYCGSMLKDDEMDCRNCGAPRMKKKRWLQ